LAPYDGITETYTLTTWEAAQKSINECVSFIRAGTVQEHFAKTAVSRRYDFTGSYGDTLMDEIKQYAIVAAQLAKQREHDIIHVHDWMTMPAGVAAKAVSQKKLVVHVHSTVIDRSGNVPDPVIFAIEKRGLQAADRVIAVSGWTKSILVTKYNIAPDKIDVVHNGISNTQGNTIENYSMFNSPVVTFLGRITHQKGPLYFIKAAKKVLIKFPDVHFIMGGTGDLLASAIEEVAKSNISSQFHFAGFVKGQNIERLWAISDVYVMPSVSEPFGLTPLEAITAGVPVIISNQSGVAEVMPHAIKIDFWDIDAIASAICSIISRRPLAMTLTVQARETARLLTWSAAAHKIQKVYFNHRKS
jgi:glycosyltransferase involved in cell wall biosynthesis